MDTATDPPLDNMWGQVYAGDQAAFLSGYVAASASKTGKVGTFGGSRLPLCHRLYERFRLGCGILQREERHAG